MLLEGETEPHLYPAWLTVLAPNMQQEDFIERLDSNKFYVKGGLGYPGLLDKDHGLKNTLKDINDYKNIDQLWIVCDADDQTIEAREAIIYSRIQKILEENKTLSIAHCDIQIIIQKASIETWGLANKKVFPRSNIVPPFDEYVAYYDVGIDDPEEMRKPETFEYSIGRYHEGYLKQMLFAKAKQSNKAKKIYSKIDPTPLNKEFYLRNIIIRMEQDNHVNSFKKFYTLALKLNQR
ncbi:hypothetical protein M2R48_02915 [Acinetobacter sp. I-MWF]|uniref:hypothetical protein n=1 Tax=Acinetobacter sp. I-MWF TaxID=2940517 RepID=UPI0021C7C24B|nr:hypothetical protein [Acinetobacter sp. I-MWF]MCT9977285.1 hypothetical protein [Acinetobacter sp. I-MWF]